MSVGVNTEHFSRMLQPPCKQRRRKLIHVKRHCEVHKASCSKTELQAASRYCLHDADVHHAAGNHEQQLHVAKTRQSKRCYVTAPVGFLMHAELLLLVADAKWKLAIGCGHTHSTKGEVPRPSNRCQLPQYQPQQWQSSSKPARHRKTGPVVILGFPVILT